LVDTNPGLNVEWLPDDRIPLTDPIAVKNAQKGIQMTLQVVGPRSGIINSNIAGISLVVSTIRQAPIFESAPTRHFCISK
jgi:hypothetical protein